MKRYFAIFLTVLITVLSFSTLAFANTPAKDFGAKIAGMNKITGVRVGQSGGNVRVVVDGTKEIAYRSFSLSNPNRFAIDIQNAWLSPDVPRTIAVEGSPFVNQVRVSQYNETTVRIVVDAHVFKEQINLFALKPEPAKKIGHRFVMDFGNVNKPPKQVEKNLEIVRESIEAENAGMEPVELDFEIVDDLDQTATADTPKRKKPTTPGLAGKTIVVDAGHGGSDVGAIGKNGLLEKDVTLKVALLLEDYLTEAGANVLMTRRTDVDVARPNATDAEELQARVDVGNNNDADLFLSIHIDSFVSPDAHGTTVYIHDDAKLGKCLHDELQNRLDRTDRGVKFANFYVLRHTTMPASLVELMFISNPEEEQLLADHDTHVQAARALFEGLRIYFG